MKYLILDIGSSAGDCSLWWRANNSGYTTRLEDAGRYTPEQVAKDQSYYNNGDTTLAVPEHVAKGESITVVPIDGSTLKKIKEQSAREHRAQAKAALSPAPTTREAVTG